MESITHEPEMVKGLEVLNFGQVELEKAKVDGSNTFATQGTLNVLYFDYYDKFILQLDNWRYALIPRLYATALDNELESFSYQLPAYDGTYTLRLNSIQSHFALENFETILQNTTKFSREMQQENLSRQGQGPEVGAAQGAVIEQTHISMVESRTVPMGAIGGSANPPVTEIRESSIERTQVMPRSSHPGVQGEPRRHYERTGQVVNLGNPSYNYSPKKSNRKRDKMKLKLKKMLGKKEQNNELWNPNFSFNRDFESIKRTNEAMVPVQEFKREEIEAVIVSAKEIARRLEHPVQEDIKEKAMGFLESVKDGAQELKEKIFGEKEEQELAHEPGMIDVLKQGFSDVKEKLANRAALGEGNTGAMRNALLAASVYSSIKDTTARLKDVTKTKIYKTHEKKPEQIQLEEEEGFDQREHPGMGSIIKDEYHAVKEKIAHRDEYTHGDKGTLEKAFVCATVFDGVKDVTCKLFREGKHGIKEKISAMNCRGNANRSPLRIFDDKYLDRPISTIGEVPLTLTTDRNLYSVPVIPGTTVLSSKVISTPPVKTIPQAIPSASTAEKTLTYRYEGSQYSTINRIGEESIRREIITNSIEPNYELNPAHTSFLDKIKASIPFLSAKKEPEEEQKEVIREVGEIQTIEQTEQHPDFMERVKGLINRVEDKLGSALCSGSTNTIDVGERRERTSFKDKIMNTCPLIKDKIESTAVQVPEYEPELYVTSTDALARDYTTQDEPIAGRIVESGQTYQGKEFEVNREIRPVERIINAESNLPHYRNVETMHLSNENSIPVQQLQSRTVERRYARPYSLYSESNGLGTRVLEVRRLDRSSQNLPSERLEEGMLHYEA